VSFAVQVQLPAGNVLTAPWVSDANVLKNNPELELLKAEK